MLYAFVISALPAETLPPSLRSKNLVLTVEKFYLLSVPPLMKNGRNEILHRPQLPLILPQAKNLLNREIFLIFHPPEIDWKISAPLNR